MNFRYRSVRLIEPSIAEAQLRGMGHRHLHLAQKHATDRDLLRAIFATFNVPVYRETMKLLLFAARWAQSAFPILDLCSEQVGSLALTDSDPDKIEIAAPWPAYVIRLPEGSYPCTVVGPSGVPTEGRCTHLLVSSFRGPLYEVPADSFPFADGFHEVLAITDVESVLLHGGVRSLRNMYSNCEFEECSNELVPLDERERRPVAMAQRLALSSMVAIAAHGCDRVRPKRPKGKRWVALSEENRSLYKLGTPVTLSDGESVSALREYLSGSTRIVRKSRWVVRGHWRNQPCGPAHSSRKTIWINPHWAGPEQLPARVKEYRL